MADGTLMDLATNGDVGLAQNTVGSGMQLGMKLAQTQVDVAQKQQETQDMQFKSDQAKASMLLNYTTAAAYAATPAQRKSILDAGKAKADALKVPYNADGIGAHLSDDATRLNLQKTLDTIRKGGLPDQGAVGQVLGAFGGDTMELGQHVNQGAEANAAIQNKYANEQKVAQMKAQSAANVAGINKEGRIGAAEITGGTRLENAGQREFKRITSDPQLAPLLKVQKQGAKDLNTLNNAIDEGKGMPVQLLSELAAGQANMITGGGSALGDREAQSMQNAATQWTAMSNKLKTSGVNTVNDPVLFKQIKDQFERLLDANEENVQSQAQALKRPINNKYLSDQQDAALANIGQLMKDNRQSGTSKKQRAAQQAPLPDLSNKIQLAAQHGYAPADVEGKIGRKLTADELKLFGGQ